MQATTHTSEVSANGVGFDVNSPVPRMDQLVFRRKWILSAETLSSKTATRNQVKPAFWRRRLPNQKAPAVSDQASRDILQSCPFP